MIGPEEAWQRIERFARPLPAERLARRSALGRVLTRPLAATLDVPAHDVSAMDGFAVGGEPPSDRALAVSGMIAAGDPPGRHLPEGGTLRIMTGAPVPAGADRVIPVERASVTRADGDRESAGEGAVAQAEFVRFEGPGAPGDHIRRGGELIRRGTELLAAGELLTPGALSLLATHGHEEVEVHRAPRVALIVTGDEVVPASAEPGPGQLRDSHTDFVLAACRSLGVEVEATAHAPDDRAALAARVERGLEADVLLLTGGVSMGELDLVEGVLGAAGCSTLFHAVAIQPGKPLLAARHERGEAGGLVFGLPGNPASVMVGFWLFVRPALRRMLGRPDGFWHGALAAELAASLPGAKARERFLPAHVTFVDGGLRAAPTPPMGSHDLGAYARGTALVRVPAGAAARPAGEACEILPLVDWLES